MVVDTVGREFGTQVVDTGEEEVHIDADAVVHVGSSLNNVT